LNVELNCDRLAHSLARGCTCRDAIEHCDHILDLGAFEAFRDEHDLAAPIGIGPWLKPGQGMQQMLRALDHRRAVWLFGDVDDPFHAQQIGTEIAGDCIL
jgi:hypothetical protein